MNSGFGLVVAAMAFDPRRRIERIHGTMTDQPPAAARPPFDPDDIGSLGAALGFDTPAADLWRSGSWCVVVEDLPSAGPMPNSLPERIARLDAAREFRDGDDIVGLYLYRESDGSTRQLFDRLVSERHVRLFRKDLLVSLAEQVLAGRTRHEEALAILTAGYRSGDPGA